VATQQINGSQEKLAVPSRTGRDVVYDYLRDVGVRYVFGVPGTNEVPLIDGRSVFGHVKPTNGSLPEPPPGEKLVDYVPCLHENIAVGAAMGYARGSGVPGVVELHITPGAAHGIGNLYNAYKAHVPIVVLCVQQHRDLLLQEPLLESDLVQIARQFTKWSYEVRSIGDLPLALQRAFKVVMTPPTQPVFLSIPWDVTIEEIKPVKDEDDQLSSDRGLVTRIKHEYVGDAAGLQELAEELVNTPRSPLIVAGDGVGAAKAWTELETLAKLVGGTVYSASHSSMMNFPSTSRRWQAELPSTQQGMQDVFNAHDVAFLCGYNSQAPVLVFNHSAGPLIPAKVTQLYLHNDPWEIGKNGYGAVAVLGDIKLSLEAISAAVPAAIAKHAKSAERIKESESEIAKRGKDRDDEVERYRRKLRAPNQARKILGADIADVLHRCLNVNKRPFTLVNEAVSDAPAFRKLLHFNEPKDYFFASGGSLGFSMPASIGFALAYAAADDKRLVINVVGDGSALFYPNSWWTATHKDPSPKNRPVPPIPILTIVVNNRQYRTLLNGVGALKEVLHWTPRTDTEYLHLDDHAVDYAALAAVFGIGGRRVATLADLETAVKDGIEAIENGKPYVLDVLTDPESHEGEQDEWHLPRYYTRVRALYGAEVFDSPAFDYYGPP
jgi:benzoylformate decarboxylase